MGRTVWFISAGLLLAFVSCASCLASTDTLCDDTMGQEFYIGVLDSYLHQDYIQIALVFSRSTVCDVTVLAPSIGLNNTFTMTNNTHTVQFSAQVVQVSNNSVEDKSIKVYSTGDVAVELITYVADGHEQVLILPVECLSTKYIVSTYYPNRQYPQYKSNFLVVAAQDDTSVNIGVRIGGSVSGNFTIHMDNMQSYLYNNVEDVTGTIIVSDKPVAVFSGHEALVFTNGGEYVVEQLLPSVHYGSSYIVPSLYPKSQYFIRVISSESDTVVLYRNISNAIDRSVLFHTSGEFVEIISSEPLYIKADKPVSVMLYSFDFHNQGDDIGNPFLSIVPATTQYLSEYIFTVPDVFDTFTNYLSIIAPYDVVNGIQLDGKRLPGVSKALDISINGSFYSVNTYTIGAGFHRLNQLKQAMFGAVIYGYFNTDPYFTYGAPLGLGFVSLSSPVGTWSPWYEGECSVTIGQGVATRIRQCSSGCNKDCLGNFSESVACRPKPYAASVTTTTPPPVLHCLSAPCQHGGECEDLPGTFTCFCSGGYYGTMCDEDYDECLYRRPCKNGGTCVNTVGSYICTCPSGFVGPNCQS